ncbi:MAG: cell division protein FtsL [Bdellovibrionales bacterium]|nr:cell division protein FtsL [Bdellovibrionales bacterium]
MSVCLEYQSVYLDRFASKSKTRTHLIAVLLLAVSLSYKVWLKLETVELGYRIAELREETQMLNYERQELELQLSVATRTDLLSKRAYEELNLRAPNPDQIVRVVLEK